MFHRFFNLRLKHKIAVLCAALVIVSTGFSGLLLYRNAADVATETEADHSSEIILQVNNYLNEKLKGIITRALNMRTDSTFNDTAARFLIDDDPRHYASALSYFSDVFLEMRYSEPFIASVFLYTPKGSFYDLSLPHDPGVRFTGTKLFEAIGQKPSASVYWLPRSESELYRGGEKVISLVLRFSISGYGEELYMVIQLKESMILQYLRDSRPKEGSTTMLVDRESGDIVVGDSPLIGQLLAGSDFKSGLLGGEFGRNEAQYGDDSYTINYAPMKVAPWTLVNIQSQRTLLEKLRGMKTYSGLILLISITASFGVAFAMAATITRPLQALEKTMQRVRWRKFDGRFEYPYEDEVGKLGRTFNFMKEEIHELIRQQKGYIEQLQKEKEQVRTEQRLKRVAELKALQAQMSPHFLYNTLDSIKWKAEMEGQADIAKMITALASFYRIALSRGKEIIPVKEELAHAASYLAIQSMRYQDKFEYEFCGDPEAERRTTVKFILQPLIENAIYHGIKQRQGGGRIRICAEMGEGSVRLSVEDNGPGMHPVKLQLIRKRLQAVRDEHEDGYGLYNVNNRIKFYYGEAYGLKIASEPGKGTVATAIIPSGASEGGAESDV